MYIAMFFGSGVSDFVSGSVFIRIVFLIVHFYGLILSDIPKYPRTRIIVTFYESLTLVEELCVYK